LGLILTGLSPQSAAGYTKDYRAFAAFTGELDGQAALLHLYRLEQGAANALVLAYQSEMEAHKLSPATIARRLAALRRATDRGRIVGLTSLKLELDPPKAEAFRDCSGPGTAGWKKLLELAEREAADGGSQPIRDLAVLLLLHDRALRRGEVVTLDHPDDFDPTRPAVQVLGKGRRQKEWLTINARTTAAIAKWLSVRGEFPGALFLRTDRAQVESGRLTGESVNRLVKALAVRAKVGRTVRAHGLRHQAITEALDGGWDVRDVRSFSRHGKIDTVLIYDDRRKDVGGDITRSMGTPKRRGRGAGK
jgi:integrase/recombinase XerC